MEACDQVGIDISKQRLDWQANDAQNTELASGRAAYTQKGIYKMTGQWKRGNTCLEEFIVCFEHTCPLRAFAGSAPFP